MGRRIKRQSGAGFYSTMSVKMIQVMQVPVCFSRVQLFEALWTVARQAPLSMGFSSQEYGSGLHALLQGIFSTQGSYLCLLRLLHWQLDSIPLEPPGKPTSHA